MNTVGLDTIFKALDVSLDRRKALFAVVGLFVTFLVVGLFAYMAVEAGSSFITVLSGLAAILSGWILLTFVVGALAKMSYDDLSGNPALGWGRTISHTRRHLSTLLFSPLALIAGVFLTLVVEVVLFFLGRIPYLGELWVAVIFLPLLLVNLFLVLLVYLGTLLIPPVIVAEGRGVLETLRRVQELVRRAPGRILVYLSIAVILSLLAASIIAPLVYSALGLTQSAAEIAFGEQRMVEFQRAMPLVFGPSLTSDFFGIPYGLSAVSRGVPFTMKVARLFLTVAVASLPIVILAELFVVFPVVCACAIYLSVTGETVTPGAGAAQPESTAPPQATFCMQCGAKLSPGNRFCPRCGARQE